MGKESSGIDVATSVAHKAIEIAEEYGFVIRYYSHNTHKNLTTNEIRALVDAGLKVGVVWETTGDHASYFTRAQGEADARDALKMANEVGQPLGSTIYFAVDCDTVPGTPENGVTAYFAAVHATFLKAGAPFLIGVYGSGTICGAIRADGFASHAWLAQSRGWSGYHAYREYDLIQGPTQNGWGTNFDTNTVREGGDPGFFG